MNATEGDYTFVIANSLLYFEALRFGKLPPDQRVTWRSDSGIHDGSNVGVDLKGGYYDVRDNVKFGFPMAFTVTMLSWDTVEFRDKLEVNGELINDLKAIKWVVGLLVKTKKGVD